MSRMILRTAAVSGKRGSTLYHRGVSDGQRRIGDRIFMTIQDAAIAENPDARAAVGEFSWLVQRLTNSLLGEEDPWRGFLLALASYVGAEYATLILTPPNDPSLGANFTPSAPPQRAQEYLDRYLEIDPFVNLPEGQVLMMYDYVGPGALDRAAPYIEWLNQVEGAHIMGVDLKISSGFEARLRLTARPGAPLFSDDARRRVEEIVPHLRQVLELHQTLAASRSEHSLLVDAVEQLAVGTILLDHRLEVIRMNEVAAAILAEADGISLAGRTILINAPASRQQFRTLAKEALRSLSGERSGQQNGTEENRAILSIARPSGRRELALVVRPISLPPFMHTGQAPAVALVLTDPGRERMIQPDVVRKVFAFTPTEAAIAAALANGLSVADTANLLSIARNTVRAHLRSIFSKLGLNRQSQLVHLIHSSIPEALGSGK